MRSPITVRYSMGKLTQQFGFLIAYIAPGLVALYAVAPFSTRIDGLLMSGNGSPSAAALAPIAVITIIAGMCVNALGAFTTKLLFRKMIASPATDEDISKLRADHMAVYEKIIEHSYRYFECYNNTAISIVLLVLSINLQPVLLSASSPLLLIHSVGLTGVAALCFVAAYFNYKGFTVRVKALVNSTTKEIDMCGGGGPSPSVKEQQPEIPTDQKQLSQPIGDGEASVPASSSPDQDTVKPGT